jgi:hypothetical protein
MLYFLFSFFCICSQHSVSVQTTPLLQDTTAIFTFEKNSAFSKNDKSYFFQLDSRGNCIYKNLNQLLKKNSYHKISLSDSTTKSFFEKVNQIKWKDATEIKMPEFDMQQQITIQYTKGTNRLNFVTAARPLMYNIKPVSIIIDKIIATSKWKKINI